MTFRLNSQLQQNLLKEKENELKSDIDEIYAKFDLERELISGGSVDELLRPPVKSVGYRTETQIQLMRKMRYVSNQLNLTQALNPDYESAVTILLDTFEATRQHTFDEEYRRKMNYLLRWEVKVLKL